MYAVAHRRILCTHPASKKQQLCASRGSRGEYTRLSKGRWRIQRMFPVHTVAFKCRQLGNDNPWPVQCHNGVIGHTTATFPPMANPRNLYSSSASTFSSVGSATISPAASVPRGWGNAEMG